MLILLMACLHREPVDVGRAMDPEQAPILPAPEADLYAAVGGQPSDPLVARAAQGLPWDEALSGAAGALALASDRGAELGQARWAAWRAGYPYPLRSVAFVSEAPGAFPKALIEALRPQVRPGDHVGLARARVGLEDRWVAVIGHASRTVTPFPRQVARGEALRLEGAGIARWRLTSPTGVALSGQAPGAPALTEAGEWWLELLADDGRVVVSAPVTVGMPPSPTAPLDLPGRSPSGPEEALDSALAELSDLRAVFDLPALAADETLDVLARQPLASAEPWDAGAATARVRAAGFADGGGLTCKAATVPLCLDALIRTGSGREVLLDPDWRLAGGGARVESSGVTLVLFLAVE